MRVVESVVECVADVLDVQDQQKEVRQHCVNAEPHHGELWCSVSKAIDNWRLKTNDILPLAASALQIPT